jgi:hypothetical protein
MYDRIKEMVRKLKLNATILQYLEREFGCSWRLVTWLSAHFAYYDVNILCAFVGKCARYFWKLKWCIHILCKWLIFQERDIVEKLYSTPFRKIRLYGLLPSRMSLMRHYSLAHSLTGNGNTVIKDANLKIQARK